MLVNIALQHESHFLGAAEEGIFMLIAHFLLHWLFSECSVTIACFSLNHLPHRRRRKMSRGIMGLSESRAAALTASLFVSLKRNPRVTSAVSSIAAHKPACPRRARETEGRRLFANSNWPAVRTLQISLLLPHAITQMGRRLWELLQEKQERPHPLFKMNPY